MAFGYSWFIGKREKILSTISFKSGVRGGFGIQVVSTEETKKILSTISFNLCIWVPTNKGKCATSTYLSHALPGKGGGE